MSPEIPIHAPVAVHRRGNEYIRVDGSPFVSRKQDLDDIELDRQNVRGYAGLAQELFEKYDGEEITSFPSRRKNLAESGSGISNPLAKLELHPSKARELVEGLEKSLSILACISPRQEQAIRLRFQLDSPSDTHMMSLKGIGQNIPSVLTGGDISGPRARIIIADGIRRLRVITRTLKLKQDLWGNNELTRAQIE